MSFLAPLFLFGAAAVALPVVFHLIRRTTRERTVFSSLMFLLPTPPRLTRRSRLEHLLLLALRCIVLCLLALGFARPFFRHAISSPPAEGGRRTLLLVDTSASMRRAGLWAEAKERAATLLRNAAPGDQVGLYTFARELTPIITFEQWNSAAVGERAALAQGKLAENKPGWNSTYLGNALIRAAEILGETGDKKVTVSSRIVLISDLQEGGRLEPLQGYEWPKGIELTVESLHPPRVSNASLQLVTDLSDAEPKPGNVVRVRVSNAADSKREQFKVGWAQPDSRAFIGKPSEVYIPPGQSRTVALPGPASAPGSGRPLSSGSSPAATECVTLLGDDEDFDNTVFVIPPETTRLKVLYLGTDAVGNTRQPLYFLSRAFQQTSREAVTVQVHNPSLPLAGEAQASTLLILADNLPDAQARELHTLVAGGKTVLCALKNVAAAATLARVAGVETLPVEEAHPNSYAMLAEVDFRHPIFAPFADPRFSDFTKIHIWNYRRLDASAIPGARVLAKYDSKDPALLEIPIEKGRLLLLTTSWTPDDSQLALSTKFVPLLYSMLEQSGGPSALPTQYRVGDPVPLPPLGSGNANGANRVMLAPGGSRLALSNNETNFSQTVVPGIYAIADAQPARRFAVNLDALESRVTPVSVDEFERLGAPVAKQLTATRREIERNVHLQNAELEQRQKLWRWLLIATLLVLLFETALAGLTARQLARRTENPA